MTSPSAPLHPSLRSLALPGVGSIVQALAALIWLPQAALLAWAVEGIASKPGMHAVLWPAAGILGLGMLRAVAEAWGLRRVYRAARARLSVLRAQAASALSLGSPMDRSRAPSGVAASVLAEQAEAIVPYLVRYHPARWRVMVVPPLILVAVAWQSWIAALVLLVAAPLIPLFMVFVGLGAQAASRAQMGEMGSMNAFLLDRLRGLATLRALGAVGATADRLLESAQGLRHRTMAVLRIAFLSSAVLELFSALGVAMVAVYVGFHLLGTLGFGAWGARLSLGQGLFVLLLAPAFFEPLRDLSAVWHDRAAGEAALDALARLGRHEIPLVEGYAAVVGGVPAPVPSRPRTAPSVVVRDLYFAHPGQTPVFDGFHLRIAAGEHVALTGASGSGKTALLSLLAGLQPAARGEIEIGGLLLADRNIAALRQRIGWMGQRPHVFAGTVEANVSLGRGDVDAQCVAKAMRFARLDAVAQAHPRNMLGEGGSGLSGGEAARLALARMAVHAGADLLLADEPTAHLDSETAGRAADALVALAEGRTLIVATHDPVLASRMDRVIDLDMAGAMEQAA